MDFFFWVKVMFGWSLVVATAKRKQGQVLMVIGGDRWQDTVRAQWGVKKWERGGNWNTVTSFKSRAFNIPPN